MKRNAVSRALKKKGCFLTTAGSADFAITRLHAVMSTFLLRRQKNTKLDGESIIKLPEKDIKLIKLEFSKEERDVYNMVEARNQAIFNRYLREGTVLKYVTSMGALGKNVLTLERKKLSPRAYPTASPPSNLLACIVDCRRVQWLCPSSRSG